MANWIEFANRIIKYGNKISLQDAKDCEIPQYMFEEICMRNISEEQLKANAKKLLEKMGQII